jgi:inosose dehydratase
VATLRTSRPAKIAGAPISWGVSEVPGWGYQLPLERVLGEMRDLGLGATEFGPAGFLPDSPADKAATLARFDLAAVGGFVPVVLHRADPGLIAGIERVLDDFEATGARVLVLAAVTGDEGYDANRPDLSDAEWATLLASLEQVAATAEARGVLAVLHPHVGTVVETAVDVERVLDGSTIAFCFDTGHLMIGGTDPVAFARRHSDRIAHAHLKDVSMAGIERVRSGETSYFDAVAADSLYRPLGQGDIDIRAIVQSLTLAGFDGWYVLEQDRVVVAEPPAGDGPIRDARASVEFLTAVLGETVHA